MNRRLKITLLTGVAAISLFSLRDKEIVVTVPDTKPLVAEAYNTPLGAAQGFLSSGTVPAPLSSPQSNPIIRGNSSPGNYSNITDYYSPPAEPASDLSGGIPMYGSSAAAPPDTNPPPNIPISSSQTPANSQAVVYYGLGGGVVYPTTAGTDDGTTIGGSTAGSGTGASGATNSAPAINSFLPVSLNPSVNAGSSLAFSVQASDPDNNTLAYTWRLDNNNQSSTTNSWTYSPAAGDVGNHLVVVIVSDGALTATQSWSVMVNTASPQSPVFITRLVPASGIAGTDVIIQGAGFSATPASNQVTFGAIQSNSITVVSQNQLRAIVPSGLMPGFNDLIVSSNSVSSEAVPFDVLRNTPDNVFIDTTQSAMPAGLNIQDAPVARTADIDGDKDEDILVMNKAGDTALLFINDGNGNFANESASRLPILTDIPAITDVKFTDVNGDGKPDIAITYSQGQSLRLLLNNGSGIFTDVTNADLPLISGHAVGLDSGDADGDGDVDIVVANNDSKDILLKNDGTGNFTIDAQFDLPVTTDCSSCVIFCDINGDGSLDILTANNAIIGTSSLRPRVYINDGSGRFTDGTLTSLPDLTDFSEAMDVGDIDMDGRIDIVVANYSQNAVLINNGNGIFEDQASLRIPTNDFASKYVKLGDVDGDGDLDIIVVGNQKMSLLINNGQGVFTENSIKLPDYNSTPAPIGGKNLQLADLDGDGSLDIIVGGGALHILMNSPDNKPPVLDPIGNKTVEVGTNLTFNVTASDPNGDPLIYLAQNLPMGATFQSQVFNWTPGLADIGPPKIVRFIARENKASPLQDYEDVTISLTSGDLPVIDYYTPPELDMNLNPGEIVEFGVNAHNPRQGLGNLTFTWVFNGDVIPSISDASSSIIFLIPRIGNNTLEARVSNSAGTVVVDWQIGVGGTANLPPRINTYSPGLSNVAIDLSTQTLPDFIIAATDFENDPLTYTWKFDGTTIGTAANLNSSAYSSLVSAGNSYTIEAAVSDGYNPAVTHTWTLNITQSNLPPQISSYTPTQPDITIDLSTGGFVNFGITATDPENDPLTYTWKFDGTTIGTAANLNSSAYSSLVSAGNSYTIEAAVSDGHNPAVTHTWTLNIIQTIPTNHPPTIDTHSPASQNLSLTVGASQPFSITASDPDTGDTLAYSWTVNGQAVGTNSDSYTYTVSQPGQYAIRVTVTDGHVATPPYYEWTVSVPNTLLNEITKRAFNYFWNEVGSSTGLVRDRLMFNAADPTTDSKYNMASIAATGFGLTALTVAAQNYGDGTNPDWQIAPASLQARAEMTLDKLLAIQNSQNPLDPSSLATWGRDGFFYHFVNINDGTRWENSEVSTIDTAILIAGALTAGEYFGGTVKDKALQLYGNVNWKAFLDLNTTVQNDFIAANPYYNQMYHAWNPDRAVNDRFYGHWDYTSEGTLLYLLAIAATDANRAISPDTFYSFRRELGSYGANGKPMVRSWFGSLFVYQYPQAFFKFKDAAGQALFDKQGVDWWENSVEATKANKQFCNDNITNYAGQTDLWGLTSAYSSGYAYTVYGAPPAGVDIPSAEVRGADGTVIPSAAGGSLSMLPADTLAALTKMKTLYDTYNHQVWGNYGFTDSFKMAQTISATPFPIAEFYDSLSIGIMLIMAENYNSGLIWDKFTNIEIAPGVTVRDQLITRLGLSTDDTCRVTADDTTAAASFHTGFIDSTNTTYNIQFNLVSVVSKPYLLAIHSFMDKSIPSHSVTISVKVNDAAPFTVTLNSITNNDDQDLMKYIEVSNLNVGANTIMLQWQSATGGAKWLAWKNIEISSPVAHDTWAIGRDDTATPPVLFGSEYKVDSTYYAGADVSSFAQGVNKDVRNFTDILFYTENTQYGTLMLKALETQNNLANNLQVFINGAAVPVFDATLVTGEQNSTAGFYLNAGWNRITLHHPGVGNGADSEWIRWDTVQFVESTPPIPPAPHGFTGASFGKTKAKLRWNASSGASKYNIYRGDSTGGPYAIIGTVTAPSTLYLDDNNGTGLQDNTPYHYIVKAAKADNTESPASQEVEVTTGPYQLDYTDGHDPDAFAGFTLDNTGVPLGDNAYMLATRYNGDVGVVRKVILAPGEKNTIGLNNSDIHDSTILAFRVKSINGQEKFRLVLKDGSGNQAFVSLTSVLAGTWQEMYLDIAATFAGVDMTNLQDLEIVSETTGQSITLYFDEIIFSTVAMTSHLDIKMTTGASGDQGTGLSFGTATMSNAINLASQYLEINYTAQGSWGIEIYTDNKSTDANPRYTGAGDKANGLIGETDSSYRVPLIWQVWQEKKGYYDGTETPEFDTTTDDGDRAEFAFVMDKSDSDWSAPYAINYRTAINHNGELGAPVPLAPGGGYWPRQGVVGQPIYIYLAADFRGVPAQTYTTNTLTLEIYQE